MPGHRGVVGVIGFWLTPQHGSDPKCPFSGKWVLPPPSQEGGKGGDGCRRPKGSPPLISKTPSSESNQGYPHVHSCA